MNAPRKQALPAIVVLLVSISAYAGEKFEVKVVGRENSSGSYTYVVPGYSTSSSNANVNCNSSNRSVACTGSGQTAGFSTPAFAGSYEVMGATLALQLPDGRVAVVNCNSKLNWTDWSNWTQTHRSCRIPLVNTIQAEFDGDKAKLEWTVSIDGRKMQSETYKVLAVSEKPAIATSSAPNVATATPQATTARPVATTPAIPAPASVSTERYGVFRIDSTPPGADVYVDHAFVGTSPIAEHSLAAGKHDVELRKKGYAPWQRELSVSAEARATVAAELELKSADIGDTRRAVVAQSDATVGIVRPAPVSSQVAAPAKTFSTADMVKAEAALKARHNITPEIEKQIVELRNSGKIVWANPTPNEYLEALYNIVMAREAAKGKP
jgi:hypothetical protein